MNAASMIALALGALDTARDALGAARAAMDHALTTLPEHERGLGQLATVASSTGKDGYNLLALCVLARANAKAGLVLLSAERQPA
ncbi:MAG: hypothetical protein WEE89_04885 [Gemmatimonadota bacterium]